MSKPPKTTWRGKVKLVFKDQGPDEKVIEQPGFGIEVDNDDKDLAKKKARAWLQERGETVRSVSISAAHERTVIVVIVRDRPKK